MCAQVTFGAVGDIMIGESAAINFGPRSQSEKNGFDFPIRLVQPVFDGLDFVTGNLETSVSDIGYRKGLVESSVFRGNQKSLEALRTSGFEVLSIANNHTLQHGPDVFFDTANAVRKAGIHPIGIAENGGSNFEVVTCNGMRIGFLGYSLWPSERHDDENRCFAMVRDRKEAIFSDIEQWRDEVDHLCVSIHWGFEFVNVASDDQIKMGRTMIDAGVSCVLGHHPHVLQGVELVGKGLIAYSLGNFIFDAVNPATRSSMILTVALDDDKVAGFDTVPVRINESFQPEPLDGDGRQEFEEMFAKYCAYISDPEYAPLRKVSACMEESVRGKMGNQKYSNQFFMHNMHRYPTKVVVNKLFRKVRNYLSGTYKQDSYMKNIEHQR